VEAALFLVLFILAFGLFLAGGIWSAVLRSWPLALGLFGLALVDLVWLITAGHANF
jgi:hypothetical protein